MSSSKTARNNIENRGFKVWLGEDGIVRIKIGKVKMNEDILAEIGEKFRAIAKELPPKPKILTDVSEVQYGIAINFRKMIVNFIKNEVNSPGFEKQAIWGGGTPIKVVTSFLITATGFKNIKYFKTEKEALEWLNKK